MDAKFRYYEKSALDEAAKKKAENDEADRRQREKLRKKKEEESKEPKLKELTNEEAEELQKKLEAVSIFTNFYQTQGLRYPILVGVEFSKKVPILQYFSKKVPILQLFLTFVGRG